MTAMFIVVSSVDRFDHWAAELIGVFSNREAARECARMWGGMVYKVDPKDIADTYDNDKFVQLEPLPHR